MRPHGLTDSVEFMADFFGRSVDCEFEIDVMRSRTGSILGSEKSDQFCQNSAEIKLHLFRGNSTCEDYRRGLEMFIEMSHI